MDSLSQYCSPGSTFKEEMVPVSPNVSLRVITFSPSQPRENPALVFVPGWVSLMAGWREVLLEMTRDFHVYYIETREKITSKVRGKVDYSLESIGKEISALVSHFSLESRGYILFGSSLGATAILESSRFLETDPLCLVLIAPNAVFRIPKFYLFIIRILSPRFYLVLKPVVKWYLKTFRLDTDTDYAQYEKYCHALDAADPWKLKKAAIAFSRYEVWNLLADIDYPTLIIGASGDTLHEPENLKKMASIMRHAAYLDLETNKLTHSSGMVREMRKYIAQLK
ncbi:MAG: alpha/beta hydrolase [Candidatus Aminicenantes bacterium]|nr:MAG: alpha/beta hydrolase [Candidatus Aminicenantes bacterium]